MALKLTDWSALSANDKSDVVNFLLSNCKINLETLVRNNSTVPGNYPIEEGGLLLAVMI